MTQIKIFDRTASGGKRGSGGCLRWLRRGRAKGEGKAWAKPRPPKAPRSMRAPATPGLLRRLACCGRRTAPRDSAEALATGAPPPAATAATAAAAAAAAAAPGKQGGCAGCLSKIRAFCCRTRSANNNNNESAEDAKTPKGKVLLGLGPLGDTRWLEAFTTTVRLPNLKLQSLHSLIRRKDAAAPAKATASSSAPAAGGNCCSRGLSRCGALTRSACRALFCLNAACCLRSACRQPGGCCARCCPLPTPPAAPGPAAGAGERRKSQARSLARGKSVTTSSKELGKLDAALVEHNGVMRGAIPVLPLPMAWVCMMFNVLVPGLGTLFMGLFCLCVGKPRFTVSDTAKARFGAFCLDTLVAMSQLFTVLFCLVGWGWSIWWGLIALRLAKKYKRIQLAERAAASRPAAVTVPAGGDVEKGLGRAGKLGKAGKPP